MATYLLLIFCVIIWGWTFVASKICLAVMSPFELLGLRFAIGLPLLLLVIFKSRIPVAIAKNEIRPLIIGSSLITIHFLIQAIALQSTSATNTGWIIAVTPLVLATLSAVILRESIRREAIIGIIVATIGVLALISHGNISSFEWLSSFGDWLILISAHTWAFYTIVSRDISRSKNPLLVTLLMFTPLTVISLLFMAWNSHLSTFTSLHTEVIVALLFLGILGTLAQWFWQIGVAKVGASRAGIFLYLEPLATTALAVPLLGEQFGAFTAVGGLLVLAGVWWAERKKAVS